MVGLDRLELSTSPLSGVRSSHLSYRPGFVILPALHTGGAGRDRTGDLLNANQALSQLSYSPYFLVAGDWPLVVGPNARTSHQQPATDHDFFPRPIGCCRTAPGRTGKIISENSQVEIR